MGKSILNSHLGCSSKRSKNASIVIQISSGITKYSWPFVDLAIPSAYPFGVTVTSTVFCPSFVLANEKKYAKDYYCSRFYFSLVEFLIYRKYWLFQALTANQSATPPRIIAGIFLPTKSRINSNAVGIFDNSVMPLPRYNSIFTKENIWN